MPIVLIDQRTARRAEFGDAWIEYVLAPGDRAFAEILRGMRQAQRDPETADSRGVESLIRLLADYVTDWGGVADTNGQDIPWPAKGAAASVAGRSAPSAEDVALRSALLRALPYEILARLDPLITNGRTESAESGKGSPIGSGG